MADILIVDDDQAIARAFEQFLAYEGHTSRTASNAEDALAQIEARRPDLVIMDVRMPGMDGLQALEIFRQRFTGLDVVIMTAHGSSQTSIDAIRAGAFDYLTKPLDLDRLRDVIGKVLAARRVRAEAPHDPEGAVGASAPGLVGQTPAMLEVYKMIGRLATNDVPALIVGEWGTGRRLVAATIHENSSRRDRPFLSIDCTTQSEDAIEAELFAPDAGTLQVDHVESLPAILQTRLTRAFRVRGMRSPVEAVSARVVASTTVDIEAAITSGSFSRELHDFLAVITIQLPPLRDRRDDIPLLVHHFIHRFNSELSREISGVDAEAMKQLTQHSWPGNVRELEGVIKHAAIVARSGVITADDIGETLKRALVRTRMETDSSLGQAVREALHERLVHRDTDTASVFHDIIDVAERALVQEALTITGGNQVKASELLGVNRATLRKKSAGEE